MGEFVRGRQRHDSVARVAEDVRQIRQRLTEFALHDSTSDMQRSAK